MHVLTFSFCHFPHAAPQVPPPPGVAGPCLVPQRGPPNKYGPLQLWSKPQPGAGTLTNMDYSTKHGPDHLGLRCSALPAHQMALITSWLCALQVGDESPKELDAALFLAGLAGPNESEDQVRPLGRVVAQRSVAIPIAQS